MLLNPQPHSMLGKGSAHRLNSQKLLSLFNRKKTAFWFIEFLALET